MSVLIDCPQCHAQYHVDDELAGERILCRDCHALIQADDAEQEQQRPKQPLPSLVSSAQIVRGVAWAVFFFILAVVVIARATLRVRGATSLEEIEAIASSALWIFGAYTCARGVDSLTR